MQTAVIQWQQVGLFLQLPGMHIARKIIQSCSYVFCIALETISFPGLYLLHFDS